MDRSPDEPLTVDEAKQRLLILTNKASPATWIKNRPWDALAIAFASGLLAGVEPSARKPLAEGLAQLLAKGLVDAAIHPSSADSPVNKN